MALCCAMAALVRGGQSGPSGPCGGAHRALGAVPAEAVWGLEEEEYIIPTIDRMSLSVRTSSPSGGRISQ